MVARLCTRQLGAALQRGRTSRSITSSTARHASAAAAAIQESNLPASIRDSIEVRRTAHFAIMDPY